MNSNELNLLGDRLTLMIKQSSWFPYKSGKLKFEATQGRMLDESTYRIKFDSSVAPYVVYLEEGTGPHDIYPVNKKFLKFNVGGKTIFSKHVRHPGSTKHQGFIKNKTINTIVNYISSVYGGNVEVV